MKRNDADHCSGSRRSFLKTAAAGALIAAGPTVGVDSDHKKTQSSADSRRAEALLRRYGGEFGEVGREGA